jgi:hypothetical protein
MSEITRYVIVDDNGREYDYEYESFAEAKSIASKEGSAVIERVYLFDDSELVWTPSGEDTLPPEGES